MIYQSSINFDGKPQRLFFLLEDYAKIAPNAHHAHKFNEFIFLESGTITYDIAGKRYDLQAGNLWVVPAGTLHRCISRSDDLRFFCMMTDGDVPQAVVTECDINVLREIIELSHGFDQKNILKLQTLIIFLCYDVICQKNFEASRNVDYDFLIDRCIGAHTTIEELADMLGVSPRHARRLVMLHMGKTFKQYRLEHRMRVSKALLESGTETPREIAKYVGYNSYKGFRKAYKNFYGETDIKKTCKKEK